MRQMVLCSSVRCPLSVKLESPCRDTTGCLPCTGHLSTRSEHFALEDVETTYLWPDETRGSDHDEEREIRTRYFGGGAIEVVVDRIDGRVVTVWRKGAWR